MEVKECRYKSNDGTCNAFSNPSKPRSCEDVPLEWCKNKQYLNLKQENEELKVKLSGKTFYCWSCEKLTRENEKLKQALQEIIDYCSRVEQGSVIASQDCLMNSIKNVANYSLKEVSDVKY